MGANVDSLIEGEELPSQFTREDEINELVRLMESKS